MFNFILNTIKNFRYNRFQKAGSDQFNEYLGNPHTPLLPQFLNVYPFPKNDILTTQVFDI